MLLDQARPVIKNYISHRWFRLLNGVVAPLLASFYFLLATAAVVFLPDNTDFRQDIYDLEVPAEANSKNTIDNLQVDKAIHNGVTFRIAAWLMGFYEQAPKSGLYQIQKGWNNWRLVRHLQAEPSPSVSVQIKPYQMRVNTLKEICKDLDIKYTALRDLLQDPEYLARWGPFTPDNIYCIFFSDTLRMYPDSRTQEVADRLMRNYIKYWTPGKLEQAANLGLTAPEVGILASIVYAETKIVPEMPVIAGLYLNRLNREMRLQADPTVVFAAGRPLTRVLKTHKRIRSDYNTYRVVGLPPGPVFTPTQEALQAVLDADSHDYLFFCARYDFSGLHYFSRTLDEHLKFARKYQRELNKRRIGFKDS